MKIKNFPPFIIEKNSKNIQPLTLILKGLTSALSIEDFIEDRVKSKEEIDDRKKPFEICEISESQNLIASNLY